MTFKQGKYRSCLIAKSKPDLLRLFVTCNNIVKSELPYHSASQGRTRVAAVAALLSHTLHCATDLKPGQTPAYNGRPWWPVIGRFNNPTS